VGGQPDNAEDRRNIPEISASFIPISTAHAVGLKPVNFTSSQWNVGQVWVIADADEDVISTEVKH
jgi:hypothetical protein